ADELPDPWLGDEGNDPDHRYDDGADDARVARVHRICELAEPYFWSGVCGHEWASTGNMHFLPDSVHGDLRFTGRIVGRAVDGFVPVRVENGNCDRGGVLRSHCGGRRWPDDGKNRGNACREWRVGSTGIFPGFFAWVFQRRIVDAAGDYFCGVSGNSV